MTLKIESLTMKTAYFCLASCFVLALAGSGYGAALNDKALMMLGCFPGLFGMLGCVAFWGKGRE